ncbi:MAG: DJ-1/PfpI family protein [Methylotenera sp.]
MDRRKFIKLTSSASAAIALAKLSVSHADEAEQQTHLATNESAEQQHLDAMQRYASLTGGSKVVIGMLVYPGMFLQDLVGPLAVFEALMNRDIHLVWKNLEPIANEKPEHKALIPVTPTSTFKDCPKNLDVLFVPGGVPGTLTMMEDPEVLAFLAEQGKTAKYITSVCTGSLILGAAGLLNGYKATSHWVTLNVLAELGAIPTKGRVVVDRNRITGGGVTAGIDFGLKIVAMLRNEDYAKAVQLYLEYNPEPPFDAGSPEKAPPVVTQFLNDMFAELVKTSKQTAKRAKKRLG